MFDVSRAIDGNMIELGDLASDLCARSFTLRVRHSMVIMRVCCITIIMFKYMYHTRYSERSHPACPSRIESNKRQQQLSACFACFDTKTNMVSIYLYVPNIIGML